MAEQAVAAEIEASLKPVESQLGIVNKVCEQFSLHLVDVNEQREATKTEVKRIFEHLHRELEARETELSGKIDEIANLKVKNVTTQKDEVEKIQTQLASCLSFVRESLRTGSQGEVMKMKKTVMKQIKEITDHFDPDRLIAPYVSQDKCYATGEGLESVYIGNPATVVLHTIDYKGEAFPAPIETIVCELVSVADDKKIKCSLKAMEASGQFEISYQATSRGRHQLHIKVEGEHIKGSPFTVTMKLPVQQLGTPIKTIGGLKNPCGVAVNQRGEIIVAEKGGHCISIFSPTGEKLRSFGSQGSEPGQLKDPQGLTVDNDDNILVADAGNKCIQKFTPDGQFLASSTRSKDSILHPVGVKVHPDNKRIYVSDLVTSYIYILNPDMALNDMFGGSGCGVGKFHNTYDTAFDSTGNVYVGDERCYSGIQVFTPKAKFFRQFGSNGSGDGQLDYPSSIAIDKQDIIYITESKNHRVSVFKTDGTFLTTFGSRGSKSGQFTYPHGIAVDKDGYIYVSDNSGRVQIF